MAPKTTLSVTKQRRIAQTERKRARSEAIKKRKEVARQASKQAINEMAEQAFGEGGLTPERVEALAKVVIGPDADRLEIMSPAQLRLFISRARRKFAQQAEQYVDIHLKSVKGAYLSGEFETAARHAEWAMEALGDKEERLIEEAPKQVAAAPQPPAIMVGVQLGGVPK